MESALLLPLRKVHGPRGRVQRRCNYWPLSTGSARGFLAGTDKGSDPGCRVPKTEQPYVVYSRSALEARDRAVLSDQSVAECIHRTQQGISWPRCRRPIVPHFAPPLVQTQNAMTWGRVRKENTPQL